MPRFGGLSDHTGPSMPWHAQRDDVQPRTGKEIIRAKDPIGRHVSQVRGLWRLCIIRNY